VVLRHDCDDLFFRSVAMVHLETRLRLNSSLYLFCEPEWPAPIRIRYWAGSEKWVCLLQAAEKEGIEVGYHMNAYARADFDLPKAVDMFRSDVQYLRRFFSIETFTCHGGRRGPGRVSNLAFPEQAIPPSLNITNASVKFTESDYIGGFRLATLGGGGLLTYDGYLGDGGVWYGYRDWFYGWIGETCCQSLDEFVERMAPGKAYQLLIHPQYYALEEWVHF